MDPPGNRPGRQRREPGREERRRAPAAGRRYLARADRPPVALAALGLRDRWLKDREQVPREIRATLGIGMRPVDGSCTRQVFELPDVNQHLGKLTHLL